MTTPFPFVSAAVLTAAQLNAITTLVTSTKTASHTLTIADLSTRVIMNSASATTITVNNSIFAASDIVEIQNIGAGVCTVTAGSCSVSTTGTLALVQNAGGRLVFTAASTSIFQADGVAASAAGLTLVKAQAVGSGVATVQVTSAFSSTFDNYKIIFIGGTSSGGSFINMILGSTTTGYYSSTISATFAGGSPANFGSANAASFARVGQVGSSLQQASFELLAPNLADETILFANTSEITTSGNGGFSNGFLDNTTQYTTFTFALSFGATFTGGTIYVYGYSKS